MLNKNSPYTISEQFSNMDEEQIDADVESFFTKYTISKGIDGIDPKDISDVFLLYMSTYLIHKDYLFNEKLN